MDQKKQLSQQQKQSGRVGFTPEPGEQTIQADRRQRESAQGGSSVGSRCECGMAFPTEQELQQHERFCKV